MAKPLDTMQGETRASYEKVKEAGATKIQANETAINRQQQNVTKGAEMLQQEGQFREQQETGKEQAALTRQHQSQQQASAQSLARDQMAQQKLLAEEERKKDIQIAGAQRDVAWGNIEATKEGIQQRREEAALTFEGHRLQADAANQKLSYEQRQDAQNKLFEKRQAYDKELFNIQDAKNSIFFSQSDQSLAAAMAGNPAMKKLAENMQAKAGIEGMQKGDPTSAPMLFEALTAMEVRVMIKKAKDLGEWNPSQQLIGSKNPEVMQMQDFMAEAQQAFAREMQLEAQASIEDPEMREFFHLMHSDNQERGRRIARAAARAFDAFYMAGADREIALEAARREFDEMADFTGQQRKPRPLPQEEQTAPTYGPPEPPGIKGR